MRGGFDGDQAVAVRAGAARQGALAASAPDVGALHVCGPTLGALALHGMLLDRAAPSSAAAQPWPIAPHTRQQIAAVRAALAGPALPLAVKRPAQWAPIALRLSLGLVGTVLTTLSLWSLAPPPL